MTLAGEPTAPRLVVKDGELVAGAFSKSPPDRARTGGGGNEPPRFEPDAARRKFTAKRINEHVKAIYSVTNTLGAAIIGTAYVLPEIQGVKVVQELDRPSWVLLGLIVIASGHAAIRWGMRKED